jgi:GNAT superfamily N-acetyltransferase
MVRPAAASDLAAIARVAEATGQVEEWSGTDPAYVRHLLAHGRVAVAEGRGTVTGFGASRRIGDGPAAVTMLCDLFVDPRFHGQGTGQALLAALWEAGTPRMTFSSLHAHALPLYTRAGLDAWWPLLYLGGDVRALRGGDGGNVRALRGRDGGNVPALRSADGWAVAVAAPAEVAAFEAEWTGIDRTADHLAWAARPGGRPVLARRGPDTLAAGTVAGEGAEYGIVHLAVAPAADDAEVAGAVLAILASLDPPDGRARVCLPGPHPATRELLTAGWNIDFMDVFMATDPGLLDPRRAVPSPALA